MKKISDDVKNKKIERVYLLCGEEKYLVRNAKHTLLTGLVPADDTMNFIRMEGKDVSGTKIIDFAETMPFFAEYRVVLVENSGWFKNGNEEMEKYIPEIPDSACLIFVEDEIDKRCRLFKLVGKNGYVCECQKKSDKDLKMWMARYLDRSGKKITVNHLNILSERLGDNMDHISTELEKLIAYCGEREVVELEDIDAICTVEITGRIFEMMDAIGNRNPELALQLYYDLIATKEAPQKILAMLSRQFNIMLQLMELEKMRVSASDMAVKTGMRPFVVTKTLKQCKNFSYKTVRGALRMCNRMDERIKTGNITDFMAVELLLVMYSKRK